MHGHLNVKSVLDLLWRYSSSIT